MACTAPEQYYKRDPSKFGGVRGLTKDARAALIGGALITVACGKCMDCRLARAREWSLRCMHEAQLYASNVFVTLTYDDENLPANYGLDYSHFQSFMHRLRKSAPGRGRFFMCGEYGEQYGRPHYHSILFGCDFPDKVLWKLNKRGEPLYTSVELSTLWGKGFCSFGDVTIDSAGYVARYSTKKITGPMAGSIYQWMDEDGEVFDREPPFLQPSLKPGIGARWFERYHSDVFPCDYLVYGGKKFPVPRYYSKLYEKAEASKFAVVKRERMMSAKDGRMPIDGPDGRGRGRRLATLEESRILRSANKRNMS